LTDRGPAPAMDIRALGPADLEAMHALLTVFGEAFEEVDTYGAARPSPDYLQRLLDSETFIALAAFDAGRVVGGLAAYELRKFERERSEIFIYDLAVAATHRRRGIATALLREMQRIAAARGAWVVFIQADADDERAIAVYERLGTREAAVHFDIPVE
jgi:aminoglycoside 3-N-acetyltransferase I